jgi:two-component system chemotaxis response regulator CheB
MFQSGAEEYGSRVIGVLLSGNLSDGVAGLVAIKECGGLSLARDPEEAEAPSMPRSAIIYDDVDAVFPVQASASLLSQLVSGVGIDEASHARGVRRLSANGAHGVRVRHSQGRR